jgi:hypothetical protein
MASVLCMDGFLGSFNSQYQNEGKNNRRFIQTGGVSRGARSFKHCKRGNFQMIEYCTIMNKNQRPVIMRTENCMFFS